MPKPNTVYNCEVCGVRVERYIIPSTKAKWPGRFCSRTCAGEWRKAGNHPRWSGGKVADKDGYIYVRKPDHPHATNRGYVFEHRLVMEAHLGRFLKAEEVVHHENDIPGDNDIGNLRLFPNQRAHKRFHEQQRQRNSDGTYAPRDR